MFFILSKLLLFLINPLVWILALMLTGFFHKKESIKKVSRIGALAFFIFFTNPLIINQVLQSWEPEPVTPDAIPLVSAGVVLGGATEENKVADEQIHLNQHAERMTEALRLLEIKIIREVIISGASGSVINKGEKEANKLLNLATSLGFESSAITIENGSRNTHENARFVAELLKERGRLDQPVLLITSAFHIPRAKRCFEKQGIKVIPYPVDYMSNTYTWSPAWLIPNGEALTRWEMMIKEWVGFLVYRLMGYA